jgi:hypothetical protein
MTDVLPRKSVGDPLLESILGRIHFRLIDETQAGSFFDFATNSTFDSACPEQCFRAFDVANTQIFDRDSLLLTLDFLRTPRLSTLSIGYIINQLIGNMPSDESYVNVGVYYGYSLVSGIVGNHDKTCIGVDNFSDPAKTRLVFEKIYAHHKSPRSQYFAADYRDYFSKSHIGKIGVYFYDGDHAYEHQLNGLEVAHPYLAAGSYILVDDTNMPHVRSATLDFIDKYPEAYDLVLDKPTPNNGHPTYWNGLMILKRRQ